MYRNTLMFLFGFWDPMFYNFENIENNIRKNKILSYAVKVVTLDRWHGEY